MNYNSKRLTNPLKPICKCRKAEFNTLVEVVRGSTSTKEHNKNLAFRKAMEELTSPCTVKESLTLAEIVKEISYPIANEETSIACDVFDRSSNGVKPNGFFILVGNEGSVKCAESIYYFDDRYYRNSSNSGDQRITNLHFPLTDKDITVIKKVLSFTGLATDYSSDPTFKSPNYSGTIYVYKLKGTD